MDPELVNVLGKHASRVTLPSASSLNPQATPKPRRPEQRPDKLLETEVPPTPAGCIAPIFPIVPESEVHKYLKEDRKPDDVIGNYQRGKIDPELNELALREVAAERGISVEELLAQNPDKKLDKKLEFANMDQQPPAGPPPRTQEMSIDEARRMVREADAAPKGQPKMSEDEEELKLLEEKQTALRMKIDARTAPPVTQTLQTKYRKSNLPPRKVHPLLARLREKLSLDVIDPCIVEINGLKFGLLPPPGSVQAWSLRKISLANPNSPQELAITIRNVVVCSSLVTVEGESLISVLGLSEEHIEDPLRPNPDLRELLAQTLWEMIAGVKAHEDLFSLNPEAVTKLYDAFEKSFKHLKVTSSLDAKQHRYVCPIDKCTEIYETEPPAGGIMFCKVHAAPMEDVGTLEELNQAPLS